MKIRFAILNVLAFFLIATPAFAGPISPPQNRPGEHCTWHTTESVTYHEQSYWIKVEIAGTGRFLMHDGKAVRLHRVVREPTYHWYTVETCSWT